MNISITPQLSRYVRNRVKSGRYNNASEVVREALRLMEQRELEDTRRAVAAGIEAIERGDYKEYSADGLKELATEIKARGRKLLALRHSA